MQESSSIFKDRRLWIAILVVIIVPNLMEEIINLLFVLDFEHSIWYGVIDTTVVLLIATPVLVYLIKKIDASNQELKLKNIELEHTAYHDELTGLPNRYMLFERLKCLIEDDSSPIRHIAVLMIDLDRFKEVNDTFGHGAGDEFIIQVGKRLRENVPTGALVTRYGGDEFIVLLGNTNAVESSQTAKKIVDVISKPFLVFKEEVFTAASVGISIYPGDGVDSETLIKNADRAMYLAKERGGDTYELFTEKLDANINREQALIKGLWTVIEDDQLDVYYQPLIDLNTGKIKGVEALIRWEHPEYGYITSDEFIPLAEDTGAIIPIGKWLIEEACQQLKLWQAVISPNLHIAVNVSTRQLKETDFVDMLAEILRKAKLEPEYLEVEITEAMLKDTNKSSCTFNKLKELGIQIVIDDFGTGYSSLSMLAFLPIDYLKIDRSFTRNMLVNKNMNTVVQTIITMGHQLGLKVVGEGIEEVGQKLTLQQSGCNIGQGDYFSRPVSAIEMEVLLKEGISKEIN